MYTKSTLFALMASSLAAAIPVPHEQLSLTTSLSTEHIYETPTTSIPGYAPTGSEITATVTVPGPQQNTPSVAATSATDYEHGLAVPSDPSIANPTGLSAVTLPSDATAATHVGAPDLDSISHTHPAEVNAHSDASIASTNIYTSTEVRQEIVVSTSAPPVVTPTSYPAREGGTSVSAVEVPKVPTVTGFPVPSGTGVPSVEYPEIKAPGTDAPSADTPEVRKPTTDVFSAEHPDISTPSITLEHLEISSTETPKVLGTEAPSAEHPGAEKPNVESPSVEYPEVVKPSASVPSAEHPEIKPTDMSVPSGSEAPKPSITYIPSPTLPAEVPKPSAEAPSVEYPEIKTSRVNPEVPAPTVTHVKEPEDGGEHGNGPSVGHPSVPDLTKVGGGDRNGDSGYGGVPSVSHPAAPDVTKTSDYEYKVPEVSPSAPSYTATSVPGLQNVHSPSGTPDVDNIKGKTEGDRPNPNTGDVSIPGADDIKGKGKGSGEHKDGEWEIEHTHGPWGGETKGGHKGVKTEVEHGGGE